MKMTRRHFLGTTGALAGATALGITPALAAAKEPWPPSPAINPAYLTGSDAEWPLAELAAMGYRSLELTPAALANPGAWQASAERCGLRALCVNALPELRPYLSGSLSDAVARRREDTVRRLLDSIRTMQILGIPLFVVGASRLAEVYQTPEQARALLVQSLTELGSKAGDVQILLEGCPFRLFSASKDLASVLDEVALPNVGAALDLGHAGINGETPKAAVAALGSRLRYIHVHDVDLTPGAPRLDQHLPLGTGSLKQDEVRAVLGKTPWGINLCHPGDPLPAARTALAWIG